KPEELGAFDVDAAKTAQLYKEVKAILDINKAQRHIRGGLATQKKYAQLHEK
ncbi:MAG: sporulation transcriptional regulator SpoIIID, partial [Acutalibacteraceae bacterium]